MNNIKDYILLRDYEGGWYELFFYDHELTNGDIERAQEIVNKEKWNLMIMRMLNKLWTKFCHMLSHLLYQTQMSIIQYYIKGED